MATQEKSVPEGKGEGTLWSLRESINTHVSCVVTKPPNNIYIQEANGESEIPCILL